VPGQADVAGLPKREAVRITLLKANVWQTVFRRTPPLPQKGVRGSVMAVLNLYIRMKVHVATFDFNHSVTDSTQTINLYLNPEPS